MTRSEIIDLIKNGNAKDKLWLKIKIDDQEWDEGASRSSALSVALKFDPVKMPISKVSKKPVKRSALIQPHDDCCLLVDIGKIAREILADLKPEYINEDIADKSRLSLRQIRYYVAQQAVEPIKKGYGRGVKHKYSVDNLFDFMVIGKLCGYGITVHKVRLILEGIVRE